VRWHRLIRMLDVWPVRSSPPVSDFACRDQGHAAPELVVTSVHVGGHDKARESLVSPARLALRLPR
jgi:hypothetical protein